MTILFPSQKIAQHWDGALQASLRQARLEVFLRSRGLKVAPRGAARDSDNICRATLFLLRGPLAPVMQSLSEAQYRLIGQMTCAICDRLASLIEAPSSWRVAALVSTAQLLGRNWGILAAANFAAASAREYYGGSVEQDSVVGRAATMAADAVTENSDMLINELIAQVLNILARGDESVSITPPCERATSGALCR